MKRVLILIFILIFCAVLALWSPWLYVNFQLQNIFGIAQPDSFSGLQVYSLSGEMEVLVDNEVLGSVTPEGSPLIIDDIAPGEKLLTFRKKSDLDIDYWSYSKIVTFEDGTSVIASYNLGPLEEFSEGSIIYAIPKDNPNINNLVINVNIENAILNYDNLQGEEIVGNSKSLQLDLNTQHQIKLSKAGFETLQFSILPVTQEDRNKFLNFDLIIETQLMFQPIKVEEVQ